MKNTWKKTLAGLLAITLVAGAMPANVGGFLTGGKAIVAFAADGLEDIEDYPQSASSDYVSYNTSSHGFDVKGKDSSGNDIQVSCANAGFYNLINVSNEFVENLAYNENQIIKNLVLGKVYTYDGVQIRITPRISNDGKSVIVNYELANTNDSVKYVKLGSACDTMFAGNDRCDVALTGSGIRMTYNDLKFNVALNDKAASGKWVGLFSGYRNHAWDNGNTYTSGNDSACTWHWDYTLQPGQVISTNAFLSAGDFFILDYDTDGGTSIPPILFADSTVPEEPETPVRAGYNFLGWYADAERTIPFEFGDAVTQDTTIYAKWEEHEANWSGRVMDDATSELLITEDGNWKQAVTGAVLHADDVYYYGDYPTNADVTITEGYENVVSVADVYFSNSEGTKITKPVVGEQYFVTAKVNVDQNAKVDEPNKDLSVLFLTKEVRYEPKPLNKCKIYYKNADGEKVLVNPNENGKYDIPYFTFNGEEQAPEIVIENDVTRKTTDGLVTETETLTLDTEYSVKGEEGSCTKASSVNDYWFGYAASDTVDDKANNYSGEASFNWGIDSISANIAVEASDNIIYDGSELTAYDFEFTGNDIGILDLDNTKITVKNYDSGEAIVSAGQYTAAVTISNPNYKDVTVNVPVTVYPRKVSVTPDTGLNMTYGDTAVPNITYTFETAVDEDGDGVWDSTTGFIEGDPALGADITIANFDYDYYTNNAGTYDYTINGWTNNNYEPILSGTSVFTVNRKQLTEDMFKVDETNYTYDGHTKWQAPNFTADDGTFADNAATPKLTANDFEVGGTSQAVLPGRYNLEFSANEDGNYTGLVTFYWYINPDKTYSAVVSVEGKEYNGVEVTPAVTYKKDGADTNAPAGAVTTYSYYAVEGEAPETITKEYISTLTELDGAPKDAGTYIVKASTSSDIYVFDDTYAVFKITPKPIVLTPVSASKVYGSEDPDFTKFSYDENAIIEGDTVNITGSYGLDANYNTAADVGVYGFGLGDLTTDNDNYTLVIDGEATFTVTPRTIVNKDIIVISRCIADADGWAYPNEGINVIATINGKETVLEENKDYEIVSATKTKNLGMFSVQLEGIGNYTGFAANNVEVITADEIKANLAMDIIGTKDDVKATFLLSRNVEKCGNVIESGYIYSKTGADITGITYDSDLIDDVNIKKRYAEVATNDGSVQFSVTDGGDGISIMGYVVYDTPVGKFAQYTPVKTVTYEQAVNETVTSGFRTEIYSVKDGNKVTFRNYRSADGEKMTILESGFIYSKTGADISNATVESGIDEINIKRSYTDDPRLIATIQQSITDTGSGISIKGYIKYQTSNGVQYEYSDIINTTYAQASAGLLV